MTNDQMNTYETNEIDLLSKCDRDRSNFVRELIRRRNEPITLSAPRLSMPPKRIVQFWDDLGRLPQDVKECMDSWKQLEKSGFELKVYDEKATKQFIRSYLGLRFENAFDRCYHPSMKSDYFRYSYIYVMGGFYIDADDVYLGKSIDHLFCDGRLKLQPFCYDITKAQMVSAYNFINPGCDKLSWIFYFNTTPMIAGPKHPIIERALLNATISLERESESELPEVQATTGPGNLTRSVFEMLFNKSCPEEIFLSLNDWEEISTSKWPLSYRDDKRNWRHSNQQFYKATQSQEKQ